MLINNVLHKFWKKNEPKNQENDSYQDYYERFHNIFEQNGYNLSIADEKVHIIGNGVDIIGNAVNTFWTADDVLCKGDYDFYSNDKYIMIDIGLNIGLTSLSLARKDNIVKIFGYEPFILTFKQAEENLKRNPELAKKIQIFNYGLGDKNEIIDINYNPDRPGAMSSVKNVFKDSQEIEKIEIKKASSVLEKIILEKGNLSIFLKIDCEGAEKDILKDLDLTKLLEKVDLIIMEWHFKWPDELIQVLEKNNFIFFNKEILKNELGFIRAVKKSK